MDNRAHETLADVWIMFVPNGWYPLTPTPLCKPAGYAALNPHVLRIEDGSGKVLWRREP